MGKLHEHLACEKDLLGAKDRIKQETRVNFLKRANLFEGLTKTYQPTEDGGTMFFEDGSAIETTVPDRVKYTLPFLAKYMDAVVSKEATNTKATADVVIDDVVIVEGLPAPALLNLESRVREVREMLEAVPTLEVGIRWAKDEHRDNIWIRPDTITHKTSKVEDFVVAYEATEFHPAQIERVTKDKVVGAWKSEVSSGKIPPKEKSRLIARCDDLLAAVKQARQRANATEVEGKKVAAELFKYIFDGDDKYLP